MKLYLILDKEAGALNRPTPFRTDSEAIRQFSLLVKADPSLAVIRNSLELYHVADLDELSGVINPVHELLAIGAEFVPENNPFRLDFNAADSAQKVIDEAQKSPEQSFEVSPNE